MYSGQSYIQLIHAYFLLQRRPLLETNAKHDDCLNV